MTHRFSIPSVDAAFSTLSLPLKADVDRGCRNRLDLLMIASENLVLSLPAGRQGRG